jgi:hypothetical protein
MEKPHLTTNIKNRLRWWIVDIPVAQQRTTTPPKKEDQIPKGIPRSHNQQEAKLSKFANRNS